MTTDAQKRLLVVLFSLGAAAMLLGACGPRGPSEQEVERRIAAAIAAVPTVTPAPTRDIGREAILVFTREALQIEAERAELMQYLVSLDPNVLGWPAVRWYRGQAFSKGVTVGTLKLSPAHDLQGMPSLHERFLLLDSPQSLHVVKESLASIYNGEIRLWEPSGSRGNVDVTMDNLDYWKQKLSEVAPGAVSYFPSGEPSYYHNIIESDWYKLQAFRRDVYLRWAQILRDHGIDSAKEGFTALLQ